MKLSAWRKRLDLLTEHMKLIERSGELAAARGKELRPMTLAIYMRARTSRLRALAVVTLEEFPERLRNPERSRLRLLAQEVLSNVTPEPDDPDHPMNHEKQERASKTRKVRRA